MTEPAICVEPFAGSYAGHDDLGKQFCEKPASWRNKEDRPRTLCDLHYRAAVDPQGSTPPPEESPADWDRIPL